MAFAALDAVIFRAGGISAGGQLPEGTNALNAWLVASFFQHHPLTLWLFPYTDWGQPVPGFTGPTLLTPFIVGLDPTSFVRGLEFLSFLGAGLAMMHTVRSAGGSALGGFVGGLFYSVFAQTSQLFEGHVQAMVSIALAPPFFWAVWRLLQAPTLSRGLWAASLLYALASIGDLGMLYFYLFFAGPMALYAVGRRIARRRYSKSELGAILYGLGFTVALSLTWLYPFVAGLRPQYTTNITTQTLPFDQTSGENFALAFVGYVQDNSFVHYTYHQFFYAAGGSSLLPLFFLIPLAIGGYVLAGRSPDRLVAYASAFLAMVFATGHLYPGLGSLNQWAYDHVPYFDAIPALFRWVEYALVVYGVFLGLLITDFERELRDGFPHWLALKTWWSKRIRPRRAPKAGPPAVSRRRRVPNRTILGSVVAAIVVLVLLPNWSVVSEPPGLFQYPNSYTASYRYLAGQPISGEVLAIPFGGIYDRAPWGGVSASAALLTSAYTGADTAIFEAGTAPSLALDTFIGNGLTLGGSRNMTEFLSAANVQYIVATDYENWSYSSAAEYSAALSYSSLANQSGLGPARSLSPVQTLYEPGNWTGNVSFHPSYLLYFGTDDILYSVLDSSWYPGPSMALVNGGSVGSALPLYVEHSAGIVVTPTTLTTLGSAFLAEVRDAHVPLIEVVPPSEFTGNGTSIRPDAWNVTGGRDLQFNLANATVEIDLASSLLTAAGFANLTLEGPVAAPPEAMGAIRLDGVSRNISLPAATVLAKALLDPTAPGFARATADNQTANYSGAVNLTYAGGTPTLDWLPAQNYSSIQYLNLSVRNVGSWNGFTVDETGASPTVLQWVLCHGRACFVAPGYATLVPIAPRLWAYHFVLPSGLYGMPSELVANLSDVTSFALRLNGTIPPGGLHLSNLTLERASNPRLAPTDFGPVPINSSAVGISLPPTSRLGFLEVSTGPFPSGTAYERDLAAQPTATSWTYSSTSTGWGVLTMAQTYSPLWTLSGPSTGDSAEVTVGLQGWLIDNSNGAIWSATFGAEKLEQTSYGLEAAALTLLLAPVILLRLRRRRRPSTSARERLV